MDLKSIGGMPKMDENQTLPNASVKLVEYKFDEILHLKCLTDVKSLVKIYWRFSNKNLTENERTKNLSKNNMSELFLRKPRSPDSGIYTCVILSVDAGRQNCTKTWEYNISVIIKTPILLKVEPRDILLTTVNRSFYWSCKTSQGFVSNSSYSWYRRLSPNGEWKKAKSHDRVIRWNVPSQLHSRTKRYDIYDLYCEINDGGKGLPSSYARLVVILPDTFEEIGYCQKEKIDGLFWNVTLVGLTEFQNCIVNDEQSGTATSLCERSSGQLPKWHRPNLKDCRSPKFVNLKDQVDALENGYKVNITIEKALGELSMLTRRKSDTFRRVFGKDLLTSVSILKRTKYFMERKQNDILNEKILDSFIETASNLLDLENKATWLDIDEDNPRTKAEMVMSVDDFGFQFEKVRNETGDIVNTLSYKNIVFEMRHYNITEDKRDYVFQQNHSRIILPMGNFNEINCTTITVVSVIYDTLATIFGVVNVTGKISGKVSLLESSKMASVTIKPTSIKRLKQPVLIQLDANTSILKQESSTTCVFWHPETPLRPWSEEGCRVIHENTTNFLTTCECNHLTVFAVILEGDDAFRTSQEFATLEVISTIGSAISLLATLITMSIYLYFWKSLWSARYVNFMNLCLSIVLLNTFSVLKPAVKRYEIPCEAIGICLHFFVLALFMWMLCEGILLKKMVMNVFNQYGRNWYLIVHILGWGIPAVIVTTSIASKGKSSYGQSGHCWLSSLDGFTWAVYGPMILALLGNYVVYILMLRSLIKSRRIESENALGKVKATIRASLFIMPILGLAWIFAVADFLFDKLYLKYMFAIFNSLQGLFVFAFHCLLNKQIKLAMKETKEPAQHRLVTMKTDTLQFAKVLKSTN